MLDLSSELNSLIYILLFSFLFCLSSGGLNVQVRSSALSSNHEFFGFSYNPFKPSEGMNSTVQYHLLLLPLIYQKYVCVRIHLIVLPIFLALRL